MNNVELTAELRRLVTLAEADLRARADADYGPLEWEWDSVELEKVPVVTSDAHAWATLLRSEHHAALAAGRTGLSWSEWLDGEVAHGAVAWVLGTVFVRFCEDNDLVAGR